MTQSIERSTSNPSVVGSSPAHTIQFLIIIKSTEKLNCFMILKKKKIVRRNVYSKTFFLSFPVYII